MTLLEGVGLQVDAASDGEHALAMARARSYDLVSMDMQMPHLNGPDATRGIRALPGCAHLSIVALTANAFDDDRQACMAAGMNDHFAKPMDPRNPVRLRVALVGGATGAALMARGRHGLNGRLARLCGDLQSPG